MKEAAPKVITPGLTIDQRGGNLIIVDIGGGNFALYAHLIPDSATVKVGDEVVRGQVIGRLGNSGNTSVRTSPKVRLLYASAEKWCQQAYFRQRRRRSAGGVAHLGDDAADRVCDQLR